MRRNAPHRYRVDAFVKGDGVIVIRSAGGCVNISQFVVSGCWIQIQQFQIPIGRAGKAIQCFIQDFVILLKQVQTCLKPWISIGRFGEKLSVLPRMMPMQITHHTVPIASQDVTIVFRIHILVQNTFSF
jgi:hypothetical protein